MTCVDLTGKRILVTGAARGLGYRFAETFADSGASVVIADILEDQGRAATEQICAAGGDAHFVTLDLASPDQIERCAEQTVRLLGGLDGLVNNGAIATGIGGIKMEDIDIDVWNNVIDVNVRGTWLMTKAMSSALRDSGNGRVVNLSSDTALWGAPALLHYVASKGAVAAMTHSLAREMGEFNVTVNSVAPGLTDVEATQSVPQERHDLYLSMRAIKRVQTPEDVTGIVAFLLSDDAGFITGQNIPVNGGFVMN
jgi:NAD(P)-dependent dehydrogenase (short-subunit alcohol dehydrogenase family)